MAAGLEGQAGRGGVLDFFAARWRGEAPLGRLFWFDMILIGTAINIATSLGSLLALAADRPLWMAMAIFFSPLPYNVFLALCVWRTAARADAPTASAARTGAALWLILATLI